MSGMMMALMLSVTGGNPGAISVVTQLDVEEIITLEECGITGHKVWELYKDECGEDIAKLKKAIVQLKRPVGAAQ